MEQRAASSDLAFQIDDDPFEVAVIEDALVLGGAEQQGVAIQVVDLARHTFRVVVDAGHKAVAEELVLVPGDTQVVLDVARRLLQVEGLEVETDRYALVERFVTARIGACELSRPGQGGPG